VERRKASAPCKARAVPQGTVDTDQRLSAFRFLFSSFMPWLEAQIVTAPAPPPASSDEDRCRERKLSWLYLMRVTTTRMQVHRENGEACSFTVILRWPS
jgi:hypothetical protein